MTASGSIVGSPALDSAASNSGSRTRTEEDVLRTAHPDVLITRGNIVGCRGPSVHESSVGVKLLRNAISSQALGWLNHTGVAVLLQVRAQLLGTCHAACTGRSGGVVCSAVQMARRCACVLCRRCNSECNTCLTPAFSRCSCSAHMTRMALGKV